MCNQCSGRKQELSCFKKSFCLSGRKASSISKKPDANPKPKKFERSDEENDANVETGAIENQDENDQVNKNTVSSSNILLGDLCRGNNDLRKDAVFIDKLGKLLGNAETSTQFIPYLTKFKRSYITSRGAIKRRVENYSKQQS